MRIGLTGATGFLGRYIANHLASGENELRAWCRPGSDRTGFEPAADRIEWIKGKLGSPDAARDLVEGCDAVIHSALHREGAGFTGAEGDLCEFVELNVVGTIRLIEAARAAGVDRFIFIATCAVHDVILDDRPLDEAHPLWPLGHYGAHKAAIEKFVHSYGLGQKYAICSLRPTGIYGVAQPVEKTRWFDMVQRVKRGDAVEATRGGKEVHAADVAKACALLLHADNIAGQAFNCYDRYVSEYDVATTAKRLCGSDATIAGEQRQPKNQIQTGKLRALGLEFGGDALFERTIAELLEAG